MTRRVFTAVLILAGGFAGAAEARAQEAGHCAALQAAVERAASAPDLVIRASASATEVRFRGVPEIEVRLTGCSAPDSVRIVERRNVPHPVEPGVTYRDVFVEVQILGHLDLHCLLPGLSQTAEPSVGDEARQADRTGDERHMPCNPAAPGSMRTR